MLDGRESERQLRRRQAILPEGFAGQHYTFIVEGCFRMYGVGFEPLRVSNLNQSIRLEVSGDLHAFGALGKTVTLPEAISLA